MLELIEACTVGKKVAGIPLWMAVAGFAIVILVTDIFLGFGKKKRLNEFRINKNILEFSFLNQLVKKSYFPFLIQFVSVALLFLIITAGLYGEVRGNISTILTWGWWWVLLVFIIFFFGKTFCAICPWEGIASLMTALSLRSRKKKIGFEMKWPRFLKNLYPAAFLFILLTWLELGFGVTHSPKATAIFAILMTGLALFTALFFEKRAFCRYGCLVGRISGLYALFSPVELRANSADVCKDCNGKECMNGSSRSAPCPTFLYPGGLKENTYCTLCTECIRSCPHDNLAIRFREPGRDLFNKSKFRTDEAVLSLILISLTAFHGITMTPLWDEFINVLRIFSGMSHTEAFTILMTAIMAIPFLMYFAAISATGMISKSGLGIKFFFQAFAYPLIPVAFFYHLAHNAMHFTTEALLIVPALSDPFGLGWNLFGTKDVNYGDLVSPEIIWWFQILFIIAGHIYGVMTAVKISQKTLGEDKNASYALIPQIILMILFSEFSIFLIFQTMDMRTGL
ncbi:MAG: hypothetical protein OEZ34_11370 [Spirochaetia bacterium]|nr:hypothetical protein [Spirochaetia bacterium]